MKFSFKILLFLLLNSGVIFSQNPDWPIFRGKSDLSGNSEWPLPSNPKLLWSMNSGSATKSTPVISDGLIYFGNDKGSLIACTTEGKLAWKTAEGDPIEAPPLVSYTHLRAHETVLDLVCRLLLEKKKKTK